MRTLRYLLMMIAVMGVLSVNAQTPKYGQTYKPEKQIMHQSVQAQLPEATMNSTGSVIMYSGSALPQAAVTGASTAGAAPSAYSSEDSGRPGTIRRIGGGNTGGGPDDREDPYKDPVGDAAWPLALCALAYLILRVVRARKRMHA